MKVKMNLKRTATTREVNAAARIIVRALRNRHVTIVEYAERVFDVAAEYGIQYVRLLRAVERIGMVGV